MLTRDEVISKVADLFIDGSEDDGSWDAAGICESVMAFLVQEGDTLLRECGTCHTHYPVSVYDDCPYYDNHPCPDCGNPNDECSCDDCPDCHIYYEDCECPRCTKCACKRAECSCDEEDAVFA